jgi:hypothetical protein
LPSTTNCAQHAFADEVVRDCLGPLLGQVHLGFLVADVGGMALDQDLLALVAFE